MYRVKRKALFRNPNSLKAFRGGYSSGRLKSASKKASDYSQIKRLIAAVIIITAGVSCVHLVDPMLSSLADEVDEENLTVSWNTLFGDSLNESGAESLSAQFEDEVFDLGTYHDIFTSADKSVVGFSSFQDKTMLFSECTEKLREHGWMKVESGYEVAASFVKTEGRFTWLYLSCSQSGKKASGVIQVK